MQTCQSTSKTTFGIAGRWGWTPGPPGARGLLDPRTGGGLRLNSGGNKMQAMIPGSVVEVRTKVVRHHFQQLLDKHLQQKKNS